VAKKRAYDLEEMFARLRDAVWPYPPAALFQLADEGYRSVFELLVACIISTRTRDETTLREARRLFARARTPRAVARLSAAEIDARIDRCTFHENKARQIREIARAAEAQWNGELPCDAVVLRSFAGAGAKCVNLTLGIACGESVVAADVHVWRVTGRWGLVRAATAEAAGERLQQLLPPRYRIEINRLLVPFGKHICTGRRPKCSTCPLLKFCRQVGVTEHR